MSSDVTDEAERQKHLGKRLQRALESKVSPPRSPRDCSAKGAQRGETGKVLSKWFIEDTPRRPVDMGKLPRLMRNFNSKTLKFPKQRSDIESRHLSGKKYNKLNFVLKTFLI